MVLSHSKKFIFIHVYKTAGTSISKELVKYSSLLLPAWRPYRFLARNLPWLLDNRFPRHATAAQLKRVLKPEVFDNYFKFGIVRNPWDWQVSQYTYILKKKSHHQHRLVSGFANFDEYIDWRMTTKINTQFDMVGENGKLLIDFAGKFETLNEDFDYICDRIGIARLELPKLNVSKQQGYRKYYTPRTRDLIAEAYKLDVETFGYEF